MAGWVSSRPGSFYDHKKEKEKEDTQKGLKKERSQSVHLSPMKDPEIVVNAARFTSPSFSSTFEVSTTSPLIDEDSSSNSSPRAFDIPASLDDLDDLIDDFDDLADDYDGSYDDDALLDDYVASVEDEDLLEVRFLQIHHCLLINTLMAVSSKIKRLTKIQQLLSEIC